MGGFESVSGVYLYQVDQGSNVTCTPPLALGLLRYLGWQGDLAVPSFFLNPSLFRPSFLPSSLPGNPANEPFLKWLSVLSNTSALPLTISK